MRRLTVGVAIATAALMGASASAQTDQLDSRPASRQPAAPYRVRSPLQSQLDMLPLGGSQLGVTLHDLDASTLRDWKLATTTKGVLVVSVEPGGPADKAGIRSGDVISEFDSEHVRSVRQVRRLLGETPDGLTVKVAVVRDGRRLELSVTPGPAIPDREGGYAELLRRGLETNTRGLPPIPRDPRSPLDRWPDAGWSVDTSRLGIVTQEMTPQLAEYFGAKEGVLVSSVTEGSPAARAGLKAGDIVTALNGTAVKTPIDLARAIRALPAGQEVALTVVRDRQTMAVRITLAGPHSSL